MALDWGMPTSTSANPVSGYYVYRPTSGTTPIATETGLTRHAYTDNTVSVGNTYTYTVAAYNAVGTSAQYTLPSVTVLAAPVTPARSRSRPEQRPGRSHLGQ